MQQPTNRPGIHHHLLGLLALAVLVRLCWVGPPAAAFLAFTALGPAWYCCYLRRQTAWASVLSVMWLAALIRSLMLPINAL